jgi:hypothetical protein
MFLEETDDPIEPLRLKADVVVGESEQGRARGAHSQVACARQADLVHPAVDDAFEPFELHGCPVRGALVDHNRIAPHR